MKILDRWLEILISSCLFVVVVATFLQVIFRFILKIPAPWTEEVTRIAFVDMVFLGAALAVKYHQHLSVDIISHLPKKIKMLIITIGYVICILFVALFTYYGLVHSINSIDQYTPTLEISNLYLYIIMPISGVIMLYYLVQTMMAIIKGKEEGVGE